MIIWTFNLDFGLNDSNDSKPSNKRSCVACLYLHYSCVAYQYPHIILRGQGVWGAGGSGDHVYWLPLQLEKIGIFKKNIIYISVENNV